LASDSYLRSFTELTELRLLIEPAAARMATERATPLEIERLRSSYSQMNTAAMIGDLDGYLTADVNFHETILAACHNELIEQLASILRSIFRLSFSASANIRVLSLALHEGVVEAIETRDALAAEAAMRTLITKTVEMVEAAAGADISQEVQEGPFAASG
jgi:DNA-binding GntR family transcriptional regulator